MRGLVIKVRVSSREATVDGEHPNSSSSTKLSLLPGLKEKGREPFRHTVISAPGREGPLNRSCGLVERKLWGHSPTGRERSRE